MNSEKIYGNYTVQYDFRLNPDGHANDRMNTVPFENLDENGNPKKNFEFYVNLQNQGITIENQIAGKKTEKYPNLYNKGEWMTVKIVCIEGAVYVKVWEQGTTEPADWNVIAIDGGITNTIGCHYRFNFASLNANYQTYFDMDNLMISQQVESPVEDTRMELGNTLNKQFAVPVENVAADSGAYATIVKQNADGTTETQKVNQNDWYVEDGKYVITFAGVDAKEMTDSFTVNLQDKDGNAIGAAYTDSTMAYAMRILKDTADAEVRTMMVDMLNYGAAAQDYFGYNTGKPANGELTEAQKDFATESLAAVSNILSVTGSEALYKGSRQNLESSIGFQLAFDLTGYDLSKVEVLYSFTDHYGKEKSGTIKNGFIMENGWYLVTADALVLADARQAITITVKCDGAKLVAVTDSVASYVARINDDSYSVERLEELRVLCEKLMKFADSSHAYFHRNENA